VFPRDEPFEPFERLDPPLLPPEFPDGRAAGGELERPEFPPPPVLEFSVGRGPRVKPSLGRALGRASLARVGFVVCWTVFRGALPCGSNRRHPAPLRVVVVAAALWPGVTMLPAVCPLFRFRSGRVTKF